MSKKTVIYAFVLEPKGAAGGELASEMDLKKIRDDVGLKDAEILVIAPKDWSPPNLKSTSERELGDNMMEILSRVQDYFFIHAYHPNMTETIAGGTVVRKTDGKAFFAFKVSKDS